MTDHDEIDEDDLDSEPEPDPDAQEILLDRAHSVFLFPYRVHLYGKIEAPTKQGFIALLNQGHEVWNAWRAAYPKPVVDFSGHDFTQQHANFSKYDFASQETESEGEPEWSSVLSIPVPRPGTEDEDTFGELPPSNETSEDDSTDRWPHANGANFSGCKFPDHARFYRCKFGNGARFNHASFGDFCSFQGSKFGDKANFSEAKFGAHSEFNHAKFGDHADFRNFEASDFFGLYLAEFGNSANFTGAKFGKHSAINYTTFNDLAGFGLAEFGEATSISRCRFGEHCSFSGAIFGDGLNFTNTAFGKWTYFHGVTFGSSVVFRGASFGPVTIFSGCEFFGSVDFSADIEDGAANSARQFHSVFFSGAQFHGSALFKDRQFLSTTDFGPLERAQRIYRKDGVKFNPKGRTVRFASLPDFQGCKFHSDTNFDGALFESATTQEAARAFRALKKEMEQLKATREEQKFFRLEMKAEHPSLHWSRRWISTLYALCSDYGFSLWRPFVTLVVCMLAFGAMFGWMANAYVDATSTAVAGGIDWNRTSQWFRYILINTFPVPGLDKAQLELRDALFGKDGGIVTAAMALEMLHKLISIGCAFLLGLALRNLFKMKS